jgi:REP element-mobilizing transposase RayT
MVHGQARTHRRSRFAASVTQRGDGRARAFFLDEDHALYRDLLAASCRAADVEIWAWVLMPNHVHFILAPKDADGLRRALAPVHPRFAGHIHARCKRSGHFRQGRFGAVVMDEEHLISLGTSVVVRHMRGVPETCPACGSHRLSPQRGVHSEHADIEGERPTCDKCGWAGDPVPILATPESYGPRENALPPEGECVMPTVPLRTLRRPGQKEE